MSSSSNSESCRVRVLLYQQHRNDNSLGYSPLNRGWRHSGYPNGFYSETLVEAGSPATFELVLTQKAPSSLDNGVTEQIIILEVTSGRPGREIDVKMKSWAGMGDIELGLSTDEDCRKRSSSSAAAVFKGKKLDPLIRHDKKVIFEEHDVTVTFSQRFGSLTSISGHGSGAQFQLVTDTYSPACASWEVDRVTTMEEQSSTIRVCFAPADGGHLRTVDLRTTKHADYAMPLQGDFSGGTIKCALPKEPKESGDTEVTNVSLDTLPSEYIRVFRHPAVTVDARLSR